MVTSKQQKKLREQEAKKERERLQEIAAAVVAGEAAIVDKRADARATTDLQKKADADAVARQRNDLTAARLERLKVGFLW